MAERFVALTYDDAPHPTNTTQILKVLERYQPKAIFFAVGENPNKYSEIAPITLSSISRNCLWLSTLILFL
ncbi:polysaccharide deacetylase family protein [Nostoc sp.]|uniref:polysaccharide deacetylase family protein n=1 Tax=Nostoc sp. TaxID=1180 RepID=UPI002FF8B826